MQATDAGNRATSASSGRTLEQATIRLLTVGVGLAFLLMGLGLALLLVQGDTAGLDAAPSTPAAALAGVLALRPLAIAQLGLLVLILTPVIRVIAAVIIYVRQGDRSFAVISVVVLVLLLLGMTLGQVE